MTQRRLFLIAGVLAVLVQTAMVASYYAVTEGCFCAITGMGQPDPSPFLGFLLQTGSLPLAAIPARLLHFQVGGWISLLLFATINSIFWVAGLFVLLSGIALLGRVRVEPSGAGPRLRLRSLASVRPSWMAASLVLLAGLSLAGGAMYRTWWLEHAERAARATIDAAREGRALPYSPYEIECYEAECPHAAPTGAYVLTHHERPMLGTSVLDAFVPPGQWRADAIFVNGFRYRLRVYRIDGEWKVYASISRAEDVHPRRRP